MAANVQVWKFWEVHLNVPGHTLNYMKYGHLKMTTSKGNKLSYLPVNIRSLRWCWRTPFPFTQSPQRVPQKPQGQQWQRTPQNLALQSLWWPPTAHPLPGPRAPHSRITRTELKAKGENQWHTLCLWLTIRHKRFTLGLYFLYWWRNCLTLCYQIPTVQTTAYIYISDYFMDNKKGACILGLSRITL